MPPIPESVRLKPAPLAAHPLSQPLPPRKGAGAPPARKRLDDHVPSVRGAVWAVRWVNLATDEGHKKIKAQCLGAVAVHVDLDANRWCVSSETTGMLICRVAAEDDARKIGEVLWSSACLALRYKTAPEITSKLPPWVINWVRACREAEAYISPRGYAGSK